MDHLGNGVYVHARYKNDTPPPIQPQGPYTVGDLVTFSDGQALVLHIGNQFATILEREGHTFMLSSVSLQQNYVRKHNTGLHYIYLNEQQVARDFVTGFFTPYFEIL